MDLEQEELVLDANNEVKYKNVLKKLKLTDDVKLNDCVDSFVTTTHVSHNISRLYLQDRHGYTQLKFYKFDRSIGNIVTNRIDSKNEVWTLLKAPRKPENEDDWKSIKYCLVKNGDLKNKKDFEIQIP